MALNPPLTMTGDPCRVDGEFFVMKRKGVEFEFKVEIPFLQFKKKTK